jgi:type IV secretory pathway VirB2 component (pilin)
MVLQSRPIAKSAAAAMAMAAAASANTTKPAAAKSVTPPRVLQSAHSPAQLCFFFKRG